MSGPHCGPRRRSPLCVIARGDVTRPRHAPMWGRRGGAAAARGPENGPGLPGNGPGMARETAPSRGPGMARDSLEHCSEQEETPELLVLPIHTVMLAFREY